MAALCARVLSLRHQSPSLGTRLASERQSTCLFFSLICRYRVTGWVGVAVYSETVMQISSARRICLRHGLLSHPIPIHSAEILSVTRAPLGGGIGSWSTLAS